MWSVHLGRWSSGDRWRWCRYDDVNVLMLLSCVLKNGMLSRAKTDADADPQHPFSLVSEPMGNPSVSSFSSCFSTFSQGSCRTCSNPEMLLSSIFLYYCWWSHSSPWRSPGPLLGAPKLPLMACRELCQGAGRLRDCGSQDPMLLIFSEIATVISRVCFCLCLSCSLFSLAHLSFSLIL